MIIRSVFAAVLGLAAVLLAAAALPSAWLQRNVLDEAGFVALTEPMVEDQGFRSELSAAVAGDIGRQLDAQPALAAVAAPVIERVAGRLTELDGFPEAWRESVAASHRLSLADPERPELAVQAAPLADLAVREVAAGLGVDLPPAGNLTVRFDDAGLGGYLAAAVRAAAAWSWLAAGAVVAALAAVLLAVRKAGAVFWLGAGMAAAGLLLWTAAGQLPALAGRVSGAPLAGAFAARLAELSTEGFQPWAAVLAGAGVLALLAGLVAGLFAGPAGRRGSSR